MFRRLLLEPHALQWLGAHHQATVDEKGWDDWHPEAYAFLQVFVDQRRS